MSAISVSEDCVGLIIDKDEPDEKELCDAVRDALSSHGLKLWKRTDTDIFTYLGRTLLIARPSPPVMHRIPSGTRIIRRR